MRVSCKEKMLLNSNVLSTAWGIGVISSLVVTSCVKLTVSLVSPIHRNPASQLFRQILGADTPVAVADATHRAGDVMDVTPRA